MSKVKKRFLFSTLVLAALVLTACGVAQPDLEYPTTTPATLEGSPAALETASLPAPTEAGTEAGSAEPIRFAVIGDFGWAGPDELAVFELIESWQVDFIITTGDNNYRNGEAETIDENIGQYYHAYIGTYQGEFGPGSPENRFFPSMGNHDWNARAGYEPHVTYFSLPGNERYYDIVVGSVHLYFLNSDTNEPDGVGRSSVQAEWLQTTLADSREAWQLTVMHHPAYSSGHHGSTEWMQWPFADWGVDAVLAGHDHLYERLEVDGIPYFTNGLGGSPARYDFTFVLPESLVRYNEMHGAMLVEATSDWIRFDFISVEGELIDSFTLTAEQ